MSPNSARCLLVLALVAASACDSTPTKPTSTSALIPAAASNPVAPLPPAPNPPGPAVSPMPPAPNPPGPVLQPLPPGIYPPAPNPPGPAPVVQTPGFVFVGTPLPQTVTRGAKATFLVTLRSVNGFRGRVVLIARILPANQLWPGATWTPSVVSLTPNGTATSTLTVMTGSSTPLGTQTITVEGLSGEIEESANVLFLTVR
jgi:hypothetical protein